MKKLNPSVLLAVAVLMCCWSSAAWSQAPAQESGVSHFVAAGSGVNLGITRLLAEAFMRSHPKITIEVPGSIGSRGAIKAAADGAIALGLISRSLTAEEEKSLGLIAVPYARVAIVVAANANVKDDDLTFEELIDIYRGTKSRWLDGSEIIVQAREKSDSGFLVLQQEIPGFKEAYEESQAANRWSVFFTDQDANQALLKTPFAIGVSDLGMISTEKLNIKVLKLNGIPPTPENVLSGRYPLVRNLSFIYRKGSLPEGAEAFLDFVHSEEGAKILSANGYVPVD
jgi:phosphate transport system substrate-binding protein